MATTREFTNLIIGLLTGPNHNSFNKSATIFSIYGIRLFLQMLMGVVIARVLLPDGLGTYSFAMAIIGIVVVFAQFGTTTLVLRETAAGRSNANSQHLKAVWSFAMKVASIATASSVILMLFGGIISRFNNGIFDFTTFLISILLVPPSVFTNIAESALQGLGLQIQSAFVNQILRPILGVLALCSLVLLHVKVDAKIVLSLQVLTGLACMIIILVLRSRADKSQTSLLDQSLEHQSTDIEWFKMAMTFLLIHSMWVILSNMDIIMIGLLSTAKEVGIYRVGNAAVVFVTMGSAALNGLISERLTWYHTRGDNAGLNSVSARGGSVIFFIALTVTAIFFLWGKELIALLFGAAYQDSVLPLTVLALGQVFNLAAGLAPTLLSMSEAYKLNAWILIAAAIINVLLNFILIPAYGALGACTATSTAITVQAWIMWYVVKAKFGVDTSLFGWIRILNSQKIVE